MECEIESLNAGTKKKKLDKEVSIEHIVFCKKLNTTDRDSTAL